MIGGIAAGINRRGGLIRPIRQWPAEAFKAVGDARPARRHVLHAPEQLFQLIAFLFGLDPGLPRLAQFIRNGL